MLLEGANSEPDSLNTPRIAGIIIPRSEPPVMFVGIKATGAMAFAEEIKVMPGHLSGVSVYQGAIDSPKATDPAAPFKAIDFTGKTASELAQYIYDMSAADCKIDITITGTRAPSSPRRDGPKTGPTDVRAMYGLWSDKKIARHWHAQRGQAEEHN